MLIVVDAILSWIPALRMSFIGKLINRVVTPYINLFRIGPIRKLAYATGIDLSAILGLLLIYFIQEHAIFWLAQIIGRLLS